MVIIELHLRPGHMIIIDVITQITLNCGLKHRHPYVVYISPKYFEDLKYASKDNYGWLIKIT